MVCWNSSWFLVFQHAALMPPMAHTKITYGHWGYWRECDLMVFLYEICKFWRHLCSTAYTQLPGNCISVGNVLYLVHGMTKYFPNIIKCLLNMSKTTKYMSSFSRNVIFSESKINVKRHRGGLAVLNVPYVCLDCSLTSLICPYFVS